MQICGKIRRPAKFVRKQFPYICTMMRTHLDVFYGQGSASSRTIWMSMECGYGPLAAPPADPPSLLHIQCRRQHAQDSIVVDELANLCSCLKLQKEFSWKFGVNKVLAVGMLQHRKCERDAETVEKCWINESV
jgi:hypothetical protein